MKRFAKRIATFILAFAMVFTSFTFLPDVGLQEVSATTAAKTSRRTSAPAKSNTWYYGSKNWYWTHGWGPQNGHGNCTWYAYGRAAEYTGKFQKLSHNNAVEWYSEWKKIGGKVSSVPKVGSVAVWKYKTAYADGSKPGHVAFVEKVKSNGDIVTSQSGWSSGIFWEKTYKKGTNSNNNYRMYYNNDEFLGFIYFDTCKHTSFDSVTGVCKESNCNVTYYEYAKVNTGIKTAEPEKMFKIHASSGVGTYVKKYPNNKANNSGAFIYNNTPITVQGYLDIGGVRWYKVTATGNRKGFVKQADVAGPAKAELSSSSLKVCSDFRDINLKKPQAHDIVGTVKSNYKLKYVKGYLDGKLVAKVVPSGKECQIQNTRINTNIKCGKFKANSYHIVRLVASDGIKEITAEITIKVGNPKVSPPKITRKKIMPVKALFSSSIDVSSGKRIEIEQTTDGATLHYVIGDQAEKTSTDTIVTTPPITEEGTTVISAWSTKDGEKSIVVEYEVEVSQLSSPSIEVSQNKELASVTISTSDGANAYYKINDGSYIASDGTPFSANNGDIITAYAKRDGYINSEIETTTVELSEPDTPEVTLSNADSTVPVGGIVAFTWQPDRKASSYIATLYDENEEVVEEKEITCEEDENLVPTVSFELSAAGKYHVVVNAVNGINESEPSESVTVEAKDNLTVTFMDGDDVLDSIKIKYGETIGTYSEIPSPSKKGFNFTGWTDADTGNVSANEYLNTPVKRDITYIANFEEKEYSVKIYASDGTYKTTQKVAYGHKLDTDSLESILGIQEGDKIGWQVMSTSDETSQADINFIDSDMEVKANVYLDEYVLPVKIENLNVTSSGEHVSATFTMRKIANTGLADKKLKFYLIYALKIIDGASKIDQTAYVDRKVVYLSGDSSAESIDIDLSEITVDGIDNNDISKLEITAVEMKSDMTTGSNYSETVSGDVLIQSGYTAWSSWDAAKPAEVEGRQIESKTQYQYRDKSYKNDGHDTLAGYTLESKGTPTTQTGNWVLTKPSSMSSTSYSGEKKIVTETTSKTAHKSYVYTCNCKKWFWTNTGAKCKYCGGNTPNSITLYTSKKPSFSVDSEDNCFIMPAKISTSMSNVGTVYRLNENGTSVSSWTSKSASGHTYMWYSGTKTIYRTTTTTSSNKFYKWGAWSEWGDTPQTAGSTRQVQNRTVYRYRDVSFEEKSEASLEGKIVYHAEGTLGFDVPEGKDATVMVYQTHNTDPNKYQVQYVGNTKIGKDNAYDFNFVLKEEPTKESGNYIVALSLPGSSGMIQVDLVDSEGNIKHCIEAPKPYYSVNLMYLDTKGEKQSIKEGIIVGEHDDVKLTDVVVPEREGFTFIGWGSRTTDITSDCVNTSNTDTEGRNIIEIEALYAPLLNSVVFVDYVNKSVSLLTNLKTGEQITYPECADSSDGYAFVGWMLEDGTVLTPDVDHPENNVLTVTGNMIITAKYNISTYTVKFLDIDGNVLDTQEVAYGDSATPPKYNPVIDDGKFAGWSTDANWWNVEADVVVHPIIAYNDKAIKPASRIEDIEEEIDGEIKESSELILESDEVGAEIYYTTDDTTPTTNMIKEFKNSDEESYKGSIQHYTDPISSDSLNAESPILNITAVSYVEGKDLSDPHNVVFTTEEAKDTMDNVGSEWVQIDECSVLVKPGKNINISVNLESNPGITGYDFKIESDTDVFYPNEDEFGSPVIVAGAASENGSLSVTENEDGWDVLWSSIEGNVNNGNLFSMSLNTDEESEAGTYPVSVYYAPESTYDLDYDKIKLKSVEVKVDSEAYTDISKKTATLSKSSYTYSGAECKPAVLIDGLTQGTDYTVEYADNINAGTATVTVTGIGEYSGTISKTFTIEAAKISECEIAKINNTVHTGSTVEPELKITYFGMTLESGKDYNVSYSNNVNVGTAKATVSGKGNYSGSTTVNFEIVETSESQLEEAKKALEAAEQEISALEGEKTELENAVKKANEDLTAANTAKTEAEAAKAAAETAKAEAEAAQAAAEEKLASAKEDKAAAEAELAAATEAKKAAEADLKKANAALETANTDLKSAQEAKTAAETELATLKTEKAEAEERAAKAEAEIETLKKLIEEGGSRLDIYGAVVSGIKSKTYTGSAIKQSLTVSCKSVVLEEGKDYTVTYSNNLNVGTAMLKIEGIGEYTGEVTKTFKINPKGTYIYKLSPDRRGFTVKWKKQTSLMSTSRITGYQVRYSLSSSMSSAKTSTVSGYSKYYKKYTKLKSAKRYYVQVRTYKTVNGTRYYSSWSAKKYVKTK